MAQVTLMLRVMGTGPGRRDAIVQATADLLDRIGLADVRVADVAEAMGVSTALVHYHFENKDALVAEAFTHFFDRDLADLDAALEGPDPMTRLRGLCALFEGPDVIAGWQLWIDACALAQRQPDVRQRLHDIDARYVVPMQRVFEDGVAAGVFTCHDPAASARRIMALNDGLSTALMAMHSMDRAAFHDSMLAQFAFELGLDVSVLRGPGPGDPTPVGSSSLRHAQHRTD